MRIRDVFLSALTALFITSGVAAAQEFETNALTRPLFSWGKKADAKPPVTRASLTPRTQPRLLDRQAPAARGGTAPLAYQVFCLRHPQQCRADQTGKVQLTGQMRSQLESVNRSVNRSIRPKNDRGKDVWAINVSAGDCEDYALTKRARLIRMGFPAGALRMAVARTSSGEGHAVLVVRTSDGDLVLDNRHSTIRRWGQTDLRMVSVATANPLRWSSRIQ